MALGVASAKVHDRIQLLLNGTKRRRCRMQGLNDASLHYGWVHELESGVIVIEVCSTKGIKQGDFIFTEVSAPTALLTFVGFVKHQNSEFVTVQISSPIEERPAKTESRLKVSPFAGTVEVGGVVYPIQVMDISESGFGFETDEVDVKAGPCDAVLFTPQGSVNLKATIQYVRTDRSSMKRRGGALIKDMDRVGKARWVRLFVE
jgi:hypothetical protein